MNSAVITKIEYRLNTSPDFIEIQFTKYPEPIEKTSENTTAGMVYTYSLILKIPQCTAENDVLVKLLASHRTIWQVTYHDETVDMIGTDQVPARVTFTRMNGGQPGNYNGYQLTVRAKSI